SIEVKNGEHAAVAGGVDELVAMPAGGERPGFRLAIADDAGDNQVWIVEGGAVSVAQGVAKFAPFVNGAWRLGRDMRRNAAGEAELLEQTFHAIGIPADVRVILAVGAFEIGMRDERRTAVP